MVDEQRLVTAAWHDLSSHPAPAASYAEAAARVAALQAQEREGYNPLCQSQLLSHGEQTAQVIALIHGYTNCPRQFVTLGPRFFDLGYNVLYLRLPLHGRADRLTDAHKALTAEALAAYTDQVVDIARGLGRHVTLAGLSGGGTLAAWAAQQRADLDLAVLIAPLLAVKAIPRPFTRLLVALVLRLPDRVLWWDPVRRDAGRLPHVYPRYTLHGVAQQLRLGLAVRAQARRTAPAAKAMLLITNASDQSVDNAAAKGLADQWRAHDAQVRSFEFPAALGLRHDVIDPAQPYQQVGVVYPKLIELITQ